MTKNAKKVRPTRDEMVGRARDLIPRLRSRAAETERLRRIHPDTVRDLHETRLWRVHQPGRVGGLELDFALYIDIGEALGSACASTAWIWTNFVSHDWMLGMWPVEGQDAVWDDNPDALIGSSLVYPPGRAEPVEGGYRLSGRWPFSSGVDPSDWLMLGGMTPPQTGDGPPEPRMFMVPTASVDIIDTWHVAGLAGTGSKDVAGDGIFVPGHMTLDARDTRGGATPGSAVNPGPLYRMPVLALFPHVIAGPILGMARGAFEDYVEATRTRVSTYNTGRLADYATTHVRIAEAGALIDAARLMLHDNAAEAARIAEADAIPDDGHKSRWRRDAAYASGMCVKAVDLIYGAAGGAANYDSNPMQRHFRDIHAAIGHIGVSWDVNGAEFGRTAIGLPLGNPNV